MSAKTESMTLVISGTIFAGIMIVFLAFWNETFAYWITPVLAEAAKGKVWDPDTMRIILYVLNIGIIPAATIAAIYSFSQIYFSVRAGRNDQALVHSTWGLGLTIASVALLAAQVFIALGYLVIWLPGPTAS